MNAIDKAIRKHHEDLESDIRKIQTIISNMKHDCRYYNSETNLSNDLDSIIKIANELKTQGVVLSKLYEVYEDSE